MLTVGTAYVTDAMHSAPGPDARPAPQMVNWTVVNENLRGSVDRRPGRLGAASSPPPSRSTARSRGSEAGPRERVRYRGSSSMNPRPRTVAIDGAARPADVGQLAAQVADVDVDDVERGAPLIEPEPIEDVAARDRLVRNFP